MLNNIFYIIDNLFNNNTESNYLVVSFEALSNLYVLFNNNIQDK